MKQGSGKSGDPVSASILIFTPDRGGGNFRERRRLKSAQPNGASALVLISFLILTADRYTLDYPLLDGLSSHALTAS
jgi:hypothetical protein